MASLVGATGCIFSTQPNENTQLRVVNVSADSIGIQVWDQESASVVDPYPFPIALPQFGGSVLAPGADVSVALGSIAGYRPNRAVEVWIYTLSAGKARLAGAHTATPRSLKDNNYRIAIGQIR